jgi:hypothetical protein
LSGLVNLEPKQNSLQCHPSDSKYEIQYFEKNKRSMTFIFVNFIHFLQKTGEISSLCYLVISSLIVMVTPVECCSSSAMPYIVAPAPDLQCNRWAVYRGQHLLRSAPYRMITSVGRPSRRHLPDYCQSTSSARSELTFPCAVVYTFMHQVLFVSASGLNFHMHEHNNLQASVAVCF